MNNYNYQGMDKTNHFEGRNLTGANLQYLSDVEPSKDGSCVAEKLVGKSLSEIDLGINLAGVNLQRLSDTELDKEGLCVVGNLVGINLAGIDLDYNCYDVQDVKRRARR